MHLSAGAPTNHNWRPWHSDLTLGVKSENSPEMQLYRKTTGVINQD